MQHQAAANRLARAMRDQCIGVRVARVHRLVGHVFEKALRPIGMSLPQLEVLSTLTIVAGAVRPTELAELLSIDRSTMSRNLTLMEGKGWIEAADRSATGRTLKVQISEAGTTQLAAAEKLWRTAQRDVARALGVDAVVTLDSWLVTLVR